MNQCFFTLILKKDAALKRQKVKYMNPQLELLLKIQSIETRIMDYENEKKRLPVRKQLTEIVTEVKSMQDMYSRTESAVIKIEQDCDELNKVYEQCLKKYDSAQKKFAEINDATPAEELDRIISGISSVKHCAEKKNAELEKMKKQLEKASKVAAEIGKNIAQRKLAFDKLKPECDKLVAEIDVKIDAEKHSVAEIEKGVDSILLKKYRSAKSKLNRPPLFELTGNSCRGCNMAISNIVKKKAVSEIFVECENCGALLYTAD